jgi:hypothetical protein
MGFVKNAYMDTLSVQLSILVEISRCGMFSVFIFVPSLQHCAVIAVTPAVGELNGYFYC